MHAVDGQAAGCEAVVRGVGHAIPRVGAVVDALLGNGREAVLDPGVAILSNSLAPTASHRT